MQQSREESQNLITSRTQSPQIPNISAPIPRYGSPSRFIGRDTSLAMSQRTIDDSYMVLGGGRVREHHLKCNLSNVRCRQTLKIPSTSFGTSSSRCLITYHSLSPLRPYLSLPPLNTKLKTSDYWSRRLLRALSRRRIQATDLDFKLIMKQCKLPLRINWLWLLTMMMTSSRVCSGSSCLSAYF
jgi:hypothetical protein